jgi:hypothetical protein
MQNRQSSEKCEGSPALRATADARTTTQGSELTVLATFLMKPLKLPPP